MQKQLNRGTTFSTNGAGAIGHWYAKKKKMNLDLYNSHFELRKQRHHFADKCPYSPTMVFPVVRYRGESCAIKKAECQRTDAFKLWCWRKHLRVPWTTRRSSQSILKEISSEYLLEGLTLKLKLQYFGHLIQRAKLIGKDSDAGKDSRQEEKGTPEDEMVGWHHQLNGHEFEQTLGEWRTGKPGMLQFMGCKECLSEWTRGAEVEGAIATSFAAKLRHFLANQLP